MTPRIFDGHNDTLLHLHLKDRGHGRSFFERSPHGHVDLPRAQEGGMAGGFFAMYTPPRAGHVTEEGKDLFVTEDGWRVTLAKPIDPGWALDLTTSLIALARDIEAASQGRVRIVEDAPALHAALADPDVLSMVLHVEGAEAITQDLSSLHTLYAQGLRSLGPVWSRPNIFGWGVPFQYPSSPDTGPGLTDAGKALVTECNRLGVMLDLAHLNERGFWDVAERTDAPIVVTHACAHGICPSARNLTDRQLDALGESGGVLGVNFCVLDVRPDGKYNTDTPLEMIADHFDYVAQRIGIDHVAFGSDFDGAPISRHLKDAAGLPALVEVLRTRGYDDDALAKVTHQNWARVLERTWT